MRWKGAQIQRAFSEAHLLGDFRLDVGDGAEGECLLVVVAV
jgi:hypothetical protein